MDFAGLAFVAASAAPATQQPQTTASRLDSQPAEEIAAEPTPNSSNLKDPWHATNLVDLDFTGKNSKQQTQARGSITGQGPSLDNLMGKPTVRRTSVGGGQINVDALTAPPQPPAPASVDPFGAPNMLFAGNQFAPTAPQQQFQPTSSVMGGRPMGGVQQQTGAGMNAMNRSPPVNPFGNSTGVGGAGMGMQQRGSITGSYGMNSIPNPAKPAPNSLDNLNWKN
jgi:hypothetical protein